MLVPNATGEVDQPFVILDGSKMMIPLDFKAVNGTGYFNNFSETNFENAYLIVTHDSLWTGASEYAMYRQSLSGGSHNVVLVNQKELSFQFGGGVEKHILGIRRFVHFAYLEATEKPTNLLSLAKEFARQMKTLPQVLECGKVTCLQRLFCANVWISCK